MLSALPPPPPPSPLPRTPPPTYRIHPFPKAGRWEYLEYWQSCGGSCINRLPGFCGWPGGGAVDQAYPSPCTSSQALPSLLSVGSGSPPLPILSLAVPSFLLLTELLFPGLLAGAPVSTGSREMRLQKEPINALQAGSWFLQQLCGQPRAMR